MNVEAINFEPYDDLNLLDKVWAQIRDVLCAHSVSFQEMDAVLQIWSSLILAELRPFRPLRRLMPLHAKFFLDAISLSRKRLNLQWLCPDWTFVGPVIKQKMDGASLLGAIAGEAIRSAPDPGYGPKTTQPVFLHLFSGRRRINDLQYAVESLDWGDA